MQSMYESRIHGTRDVVARARAFGFRLVFREDAGPTPWTWQQDGELTGVGFPSRGLALEYIEDRLRRSTYFA
jgi:hypothetical protein